CASRRLCASRSCIAFFVPAVRPVGEGLCASRRFCASRSCIAFFVPAARPVGEGLCSSRRLCASRSCIAFFVPAARPVGEGLCSSRRFCILQKRSAACPYGSCARRQRDESGHPRAVQAQGHGDAAAQQKHLRAHTEAGGTGARAPRSAYAPAKDA
ncbi:MAG: hypothetical protein IKK34_09240, partial [Clostridia bacterium]|nr:hypothetical protein [Clostridia bacterium]